MEDNTNCLQKWSDLEDARQEQIKQYTPGFIRQNLQKVFGASERVDYAALEKTYYK